MIHPLPFTKDDLLAYAQQTGAPDTNYAVELLARAIACSPGWSRFPGCSLLVRRAPAALGVVGELRESQLPELRAQANTARRRLHSFRYVSYQHAEAAAAALAEKLRPLLREAGWEQCRFQAIPRGGYVVLGMLATILPLSPAQLAPSQDSQSPLVVIDDCALSGTRLRRYLGSSPAEQVFVAHLGSPPELRRAILAAEPRVRECVAGFDLGPGPETGADADTWRATLPFDAYWRGDSEFVAFAWNEPDRTVGGDQLPTPVAGWKLLPPELCLKNRYLASIPVEIQPSGVGLVRPAPTTLFTESAGVVTLAPTSGGEVIQLQGAAAAAWTALLETGDLREAEARLAERYEVDAATLHHDLEPVWRNLRHRGFLSHEEA